MDWAPATRPVIPIPGSGGETLSAHLFHLDTTGEADFYKYAESTLSGGLRQPSARLPERGAGFPTAAAQGGGARGSGVGLDLACGVPSTTGLRLSAAWQDANQPSICWDTGAEDLQPHTRPDGRLVPFDHHDGFGGGMGQATI